MPEDAQPSPQSDATGAPDDVLRLLIALPGAACPHCRYSLAGLSGSALPTNRCPECGGGLEAGLVRSTGPTRLRRLMVLMFAWLAFAGCMNATRRAVMVHDWYQSQRAMATVRQQRGMAITVIQGRIMAGPTSPPPREWWLELGGWSVLGLLGLGGAIAAWTLRPGQSARERRLVFLLVLGFIGYWGYHAFQFALELVQRL